MSRTSLFHVYLPIFTQFFLRLPQVFFFAYPINPKGLVVFYIFQGLLNIFKDNFIKFQDKRHFFQIPGVFKDQGQIQGLFQVCVKPVQQRFLQPLTIICLQITLLINSGSQLPRMTVCYEIIVFCLFRLFNFHILLLLRDFH